MWDSSRVDDFELVRRLADLADEITLPVWEQGEVDVSLKPDGSPVTETDVAVETQLRAHLAEVFPEDGFCGEEVGEHPGRSDRTWIVDGIDGTRAFTMGRSEWSTLIALVVDDEPIVGMVTSPSLGRRWHSTQRRSAKRSGSGGELRLSVTSEASLVDAGIATWPSVGDVKPRFDDQASRLAGLVGAPDVGRPSWGAQVPNSAMLVAEGRLDAFVFFAGQVWDHAAPAAVVTAAGGRFSGLDGSSSLTTGGGIYSNGRIHDELVALLVPDHA